MRPFFIIPVLAGLTLGLVGCSSKDEKAVEEKPAFDLVPQRAQLQQAKDLEKKMQDEAEERRKVIELQTNTK